MTTYDAKDPDTKYSPIEPLRPPESAPNVLIILLDDVGFGASSAFGGLCYTPAAGWVKVETSRSIWTGVRLGQGASALPNHCHFP